MYAIRSYYAKVTFLGASTGLALAAGLTLVGLALLQLGWRPRRRHRQRLLGLTGLLALLTLSYYAGLRTYHKLWLPLPAGQQRVVDEIVQHSRHGDSIMIDHYVPSFYVLTDRQAASRWLFAHNVRTHFDLQAARLEEIRRRRPSRITSYNVCYTKLLRGSGQCHRPCAARSVG